MKYLEVIFSSLPFNLLGQEDSFVGSLTWDPSLIWNTAMYSET